MSARAVTTDMRAIRGLALSIWQELTPAQRSTLRRSKQESNGARKLLWNAHSRVTAALASHDLVTVETSRFTESRSHWLTAAGILVLEVGLAADAAQSKRSHQARKRGSS